MLPNMRTLLLATKLGIHYSEVSITHLIVGFDLYECSATKRVPVRQLDNVLISQMDSFLTVKNYDLFISSNYSAKSEVLNYSA